jgi:hypothetical protein
MKLPALFVLTILGAMTQVKLILFVSYFPRVAKARKVGNLIAQPTNFANGNMAYALAFASSFGTFGKLTFGICHADLTIDNGIVIGIYNQSPEITTFKKVFAAILISTQWGSITH